MISSGKIISSIFLLAGVLALYQVITPMLQFKFQEFNNAKSSLPLIRPDGKAQVLGISVIQTPGNFPLFVSTLKRDFPPLYTDFSLSIPSLKIDKAIVAVDSNDLQLGLIHLPGAALPGEKGNVFISGHSALPIFKKSAKAVFATLSDIKTGDIINILVSETKFTYQVVSIKTVKPNDLSVVNPPDNFGRFLTLMTCVPPGLNTKRLIVLAKLI